MNSMMFATHDSSSSASAQESRPWPVSIYTLGRFAVMAEARSLTLQRKPLELLRTLIVLGGRGVAATKLMQTLWPDTAANIANHTLDTNLYRLRKLLGDRCIHMCGGQLSLNPDYCWVDAWDLERLLEPLEEITSLATHMQRVFQLYRGPFLDGDETPSVLVQRERLRSKFLRAIAQFGEALESRAEYDIAIECYQRGIEADPLAEELYRRLMRCYYELKRPAEALAVYLRCYKTLKSVLGIEPTPQTAALYREIQSCR